MLCGIIIKNNLLEEFKKDFKNIPDFTEIVILQRENKKCTYTFDGKHHYKVSIDIFQKYYDLHNQIN